MKHRLLITTLMTLLLSTTAWATTAKTDTSLQKLPSDAQLVNGIVAIVNNRVITWQQLNQATKMAEAQAQQNSISLPDKTSLQRQVLNHLIVQEIALELAKLNNIKISDEQVDHAMQQVTLQNGISMKQLTSMLTKQGINMSEYKKSIHDQLVIRELEQRAVANNIIITPTEINNYLKQQQANGGMNTEYDVEHILISLPNNPTPAQVDATHQKAQKVRNDINNGMEFAQAAMKYSDAGDALKGGDLGWMNAGQLPTIFVKPVTHMKSGEVYGPFKSGSGYHILKLVGKKTPPPQQHFITQYHVYQLVIKTSPVKSNLAAKAQIERIRLAIENGKSFSEMVKANSQDTATIAQGGDLGWVAADQLNPALANVVPTLSAGQVSQPIQVGNDWYLIKVTAERRHNATASFQRHQAQLAIFQKKAAQAVATWQAQIRGASFVKIIPKQLQNDGIN